MPGSQTPPLEPGLTYVEQPDASAGALHRLLLASEREGEWLWVDAGGAASTYGLTAQLPDERALRGIRVARAFTAHQHHQLVRDAVAAADERTGLVIAPNVAALYEAADAPDAAVDRLYEATVALLAELGECLGVPALVSAPRASEDRRAAVRERAGETIECRRTGLGYAFATDEFETTAYWQDGWWQTTVPYWVDLLGARALRPLDRLDPAEATAAEVAAQAASTTLAGGPVAADTVEPAAVEPASTASAVEAEVGVE